MSQIKEDAKKVKEMMYEVIESQGNPNGLPLLEEGSQKGTQRIDSIRGGKKKDEFENPIPRGIRASGVSEGNTHLEGGDVAHPSEDPIGNELLEPQRTGPLYNVKARRKDNKDQWDHLASFRSNSVDERRNRVVEVMKRIGKKKKDQYDAFMSQPAPKIDTEDQDDLFKAIGVNEMR